MADFCGFDFELMRQAYLMYFNMTNQSEINRFNLSLPDHNFNKHPGEFLHLWEFLYELLKDGNYGQIIRWYDFSRGMFTIIRTEEVAFLWGKHKRKPSMNFDKLARALRYYYDRGIMSKVTEAKAPKYTFKFDRLDILAHPALTRIASGPEDDMKPEDHAANMASIATTIATFPMFDLSDGMRESDDRESASMASHDNTDFKFNLCDMTDAALPQGFVDPSAMLAVLNAMNPNNDASSNVDMQKLYSEYFQNVAAMSNLNVAPNHTLTTQTHYSTLVHSTKPYVPQSVPESKKRRIDDITDRITAKRPRPMVIPEHLSLQKALGIPNKMNSSPTSLVENLYANNGLHPTVKAITQKVSPFTTDPLTLSPHQHPTSLNPPVLTPESPVATNTSTSSSMSCPQIDLCGNPRSQSPSPEMEEQIETMKTVLARFFKDVDEISTKNPNCPDRDMAVLINYVRREITENNSQLTVKTYYKVYELLSAKLIMNPDERALFDAVNRCLVNQFLLPAIRLIDSGNEGEA